MATVVDSVVYDWRQWRRRDRDIRTYVVRIRLRDGQGFWSFGNDSIDDFNDRLFA